MYSFIVLLIEFLRSVQEADKLEFHQHAATIVTDIIIPNTVWKAGRYVVFILYRL
jgi:hypothetical protein